MAQQEKKTKSKVAKKPTQVNQVILRTYPKIIFLYPLLFTSLILWIIQAVMGAPVAGLGYFWVAVLFCNLFVMAFDFSSTKFFVLVLGIVVAGLLVVFLVIPNFALPSLASAADFNIGLTAGFYMVLTIMLAIILALVLLSNNFDYWKIERNEVYHKKGIFAAADRYPAQGLRIKKEIPDIFEFITLRSGSIKLFLGKSDEVVMLDTIPNINKKAAQIDYLLSNLKVEVDQLDAK